MRREEGETDADYHDRLSAHFASQQAFDEAQERWRRQLQAFLDGIADHFRSSVGVHRIETSVVAVLPDRRGADDLAHLTAFGGALFGFAALSELAHLAFWDAAWGEHPEIQLTNVHAGDLDPGFRLHAQEDLAYGDAQRRRQADWGDLELDGGFVGDAGAPAGPQYGLARARLLG